MKDSKKYDLEDRLIDFVIKVDFITSKLPNNRLGKYIANQMIRSGTSPALNYGEALASESKRDFIHKLKIALKELRETSICFKIIERKPLIKNLEAVRSIHKENIELISIMVASIKTANRNVQIK